MRALVLGFVMSLALPAAAQPGVPELTGRIVDNADLIFPSLEMLLTDRLETFEDSTGHQIAVLTVPSLHGQVLEPFATEVFRTWALGDAERNDGVLLLVAKDERKIRIEVGYGLEGVIPDALAGRIIRDEMTPRFREGDFGGGIESALDALMSAATGTYSPPSQLVALLPEFPPGVTVLSLLLLLPVWIWSLRFGSPTLKVRLASAALGWFVSLFPALFVAAFAESFVPILLTLLVALGFIVADTVAEAIFGPQRALRRRALSISSARSTRISREQEVLFKAARKRGDTTVVYEGKTLGVPSLSSSGSGSSGSSWSSSSSSSSFSGGGGSSGGGGASGGW